MKPTAFRIKHFKSIEDSGICTLSPDDITVLAGENEAGKTASLYALRDFDLPVGTKPRTEDYLPHDDLKKRPTVSVLFEPDWQEIDDEVNSLQTYLPPPILEALRDRKEIWIHRDLEAKTFSFDPDIEKLWLENTAEKPSAEEDVLDVSTDEKTEAKDWRIIDKTEFINVLYRIWPTFIYFDSFDDLLPKHYELLKLLPSDTDQTKTVSSGTKTSRDERPPQIVMDFLSLANVDIDSISNYQDNQKFLTNYLDQCNGDITGDFLTFWQRNASKRKNSALDTVQLRVEYSRDAEGIAFLNFYVKDKSNQYPAQRSRGFLWFLSFYLRLAASQKSGNSRTRLLLIDEPGSYLHARAQRDILRLFEERITQRDMVMYSTHSPYLIPPEKLHRLRVAIKTKSNGTQLVENLTSIKLTGDEFNDVLSPVLTAIGIDVREQLSLVSKNNVVVEGISDFYYIQAFKLLENEVTLDANIFPGSAASTSILLSSLFIGWGLNFVVALDHDKEGNVRKQQLIEKMGLDERRIVQPQNASTIEDLFSVNDFNDLLKLLNEDFKLEKDERPSKAISRLNLNKVILAKRFASEVSSKKVNLTETTKNSITRFIKSISSALETH